ncbi:MAG: DUF2088 domain-containing protein [Planctomycetes bacterium]|nr:DUF2088 domain-containing protein [Planctomycetota bacterium]
MKLLSVRQKLVSQPLADIAGEVRRQLDALNLEVPQGPVAITVGSRGISQIPLIIKTTGDWLRQQGANPFIVPSMGSHNGATAEGQQQMVESLGMGESEMGMPIRSSMQCVKLASVETGDVWMDRHCYEAEGVLVVNRVKLHTCFSGPVQSGLTKMMVVGMGKIRSAQTFHSSPSAQMKSMLLEMGQVLLDSGKILAGLAILEDGFDETTELHGVRSSEILAREPELIQRHHKFFPRLPIEELNVLMVDSIGKTYSGTGMDTNVIGYRGIRGYEDLDRPNINIIAALSLVEASKGNAIGVGLADFITRRLRDAIDEEKTFLNVYTTGDMERAKIPATLADEETLFEKITARYGQERIMWIPNTLHLEHLYVSEDLGKEIEANPLCKVDPKPVELTFKDGRHQLDF